MAKGQKKSGREPKKPKASKTTKPGATAPLVASSRAEPPSKASRPAK
jgi:hypothetical protein